MFGQGSPNFQRDLRKFARPRSRVSGNRCAIFQIGFGLAFCFLALLLTTSTTVAQTQNNLSPVSEANDGDLKLRFAWGGGAPQKWRGAITIDNGDLAIDRVLAITSDSPSTVTGQGSELFVNHRIATSYGGVDVAVKLNGDATVRFKLESESGASFERKWTLQELETGINASIDQQQNRISVSRTPGDEIRVNINRPHLVFEPGETWQFHTQLQRSMLRNENLNLQLFWKKSGSDRSPIPAADQRPELTTDDVGTSMAQTLNVTVPSEEGVYDLSIDVASQLQKSTFSQFRRSKTLNRRIQIVVVSSDLRDDVGDVPWKVSQRYTPQQLRGGFRTPWPMPRLPGTSGPVRKGDLAIVSVGEASSEQAIEFAPGSLLAIPIQRPETLASGKPIRISLQYRAIPGTKLAVNYLSSTQQVLHGMDSGVTVPGSFSDVESAQQWLTHEFHLWPEDETGYLYIGNLDSQVSAQVGELKIESGPSRLSGPTDSFNRDVDSPIKSRQRMAMLESPDFAGLFQAARTADTETGQALDDWNTFYDSIDRLTQHLKSNLYDGAFVTVAADGNAIFPSGQLAPGPRFDSGVFCSSGCDPVQKDVVELMLRMFEREGLKLVPILTLNSTLPALESIRNSDSMSFDLIDFDGMPTGFGRRSLPVYNPLDRNLQGVCLDGITGFVERYRQHDSFDGIGLTCRPDCCTLLPGTRHGFDDITVQRFLQSQNIESAEFELNTLLANDTANPIREAWLTWRSKQMQAWYRDIARIVRDDTERSTYLLPVDINRKGDVVSAMSPSLHRSGDFSQVMRQLGLDPDDAARKDGVVLLALKQLSTEYSLAQRRVDLNIEQSHIADQFFANKSGGSLFVHRGKWNQLDEAMSIPGLKNVARKQLLVVAGNEGRRRYIEAIRKSDCRLFVDGGHSLPRGERNNLESISNILHQLPAEKFDDVGEENAGPVCVRQLSRNGQHWFYTVNDSPWPVEVIAQIGDPTRSPQVLQAAAAGKTAPLTTLDGNKITLEQSNGRTQLRIFLEPWSIYAGTSQTNSSFNPFLISSFSTSLPDKVDSQLRKRLYQLKSKLAKAKVGKPIDALLNGGFESFSDPKKSGWEFGNHDQANFELNSNEAHEGQTSLSMQTSGKPVWIRSSILPQPKTGRLSVSVWLRTIDASKQPPLRISVEGVSDGANHYRFGAIGSLSPTPDADPIDTNWRRYAVHFDDLPDDLTNVRIGFDLMDRGQVSIDQVEVFDRWLDENDSVAMTQLLASAGTQLQNPDSIDGARRILESYWAQFLDQHFGNESETQVSKIEKAKPFEIPLPSFEMPSFDVPPLPPVKQKRVPLFQRFQRRE